MKNKKILTIVLAFVMILSISVIATVGTRNATLNYNNIKINLDGKEIIPTDANGNPVEPFIIDGTTYLPVRGISSALGLNVSWDGKTQTVSLSTPGVFLGAVQVYDDKNVTIEFAGCTAEKLYSWSDEVYYYVNFNVKNKTDNELTFQADSLSFNGLSYNGFLGSDKVAPQSTGKVRFYTTTQIQTAGINKTSGQIRVIDFSKDIFDKEYSYDAKWVNVTQE